MKLVTVSQSSEMDRTAVEEYAIPEAILMENAALAVLRVIGGETEIEGTGFLIICGPGNNGGDGLALARLLYSRGGAPVVFLASSPEKLKGPALANYEILKNFPIEIILQFSQDRLRKEIEETDILIDALLGTGLSREVNGPFASIIELINSAEKPVFSIDIPSGVSGDTGRILGSSVRAGHTVSFGALKPGNLLYPGYEMNGKLSLSRISLPPEIYDSTVYSLEVNLCDPLPGRDEAGYKNSFGDVLTIAGSGYYYGAPVFAAAAVLKSGAGFSRLAAPSSMIPVLAGRLPEGVYIPMEETENGTINPSNLPLLLKQASKCDAAIIGPGLSLNSRTAEMTCGFVRNSEVFTVIDGDALSAVAGKFHLFSPGKLNRVLTPHGGEMARLLAGTVDSVREDPLKAARTAAELYNSIVVLKGAHSLIALPDGRVFINLSGNSGMGTAGSGDILSGLIAGLSSTGLAAVDAVRTGVFLHGLAGDLAAGKLGRDGMTAWDILENLAPALKLYREDYGTAAMKATEKIKEI